MHVNGPSYLSMMMYFFLLFRVGTPFTCLHHHNFIVTLNANAKTKLITLGGHDFKRLGTTVQDYSIHHLIYKIVKAVHPNFSKFKEMPSNIINVQMFSLL